MSNLRQGADASHGKRKKAALLLCCPDWGGGFGGEASVLTLGGGWRGLQLGWGLADRGARRILAVWSGKPWL